MNSIVFVGPTISIDACARELDATYLPPVSQGDVYRAAQKRPSAIGIIDGFFERVPAVWHKEILWAISQGIPVFGAASMGALRAAELSPYGMIGAGMIFRAFRDGELEDDDEVTIIHADASHGFAPVSVAMVDIRATLAAAVAASVIGPPLHDALIGIAKAFFYPERSYPALLERAREAGHPTAGLDALAEWLPAHKVSQKRDDAVEMLRAMKEWQGRPAATFHFEHTDVWEQVVIRNRWQSSAQTQAALPLHVLIDELRLDLPAFEQALTGGLAWALAIAEADRQGLQPNQALVEQSVIELRRRHALREADALPKWLEQQELDLKSFTGLVTRQCRIDWVRSVYGQDAELHLEDWLRTNGNYGELAVRAREKTRWLRENGLENPSLADAPLSPPDLLHWFFHERQGTTVPAHPDLHAHRAGFPGLTVFLQAILREFYFVTRTA